MYIEINTENLNRDIGTVSDRLGTMQTAVTRMYSCLEEMNTMWEGPAHDTFLSQVAVDHETFAALEQEIQNLISCMEYARSQYDQCEGEVNSMIASISV